MMVGTPDFDDTGPIVMMPLPAMVAARRAERERLDDDGELALELERMARRGERSALRHFRAALAHPAAVVQIAAARGIAEVGSTDDIPRLIEQLERHAVPSARPAMIAALGSIADESALPALIDVLRDPREVYLHAAAAEAVGRIGSRNALPYLDALAHARDLAVRDAAGVAAEAIRLGRSRETYDPIARLEECLSRFDSLLRAPRLDDTSDPRIEIVDPIAALTDLGVTYDGAVPHDLVVWTRWCNRPASALRWAASRGWHFLSLSDALALRAALRLGDADEGPWLPIMASEFGDHQVYFPRSYREGVVYSVFSDEPIRPAGDCKPLVDHAAAIIDAWTTLYLGE
jgi:hypothetical protein